MKINGSWHLYSNQDNGKTFRPQRKMEKYQIRLMSFLLLAAGLPFWLFLRLVVMQGPGWGNNPVQYVIAPLVLSGITVAIHRLLRKHKDAWAISFLLAGVIALSSLYAVAWMGGYLGG